MKFSKLILFVDLSNNEGDVPGSVDNNGDDERVETNRDRQSSSNGGGSKYSNFTCSRQIRIFLNHCCFVFHENF